MPSISLLNKIQQCGVDLLKVLKILQKRGENATDLILMVDKIMYLQKATQYQAGEYVGANEKGNLYKGIVAFMVAGLKQSLSFVVQAIPYVTFHDQWLCDKIASNIENLGNAFACVDLLLTITPLMLMLLLHSKIFLIPNQSYFLSMASKCTCFMIPFILLRTPEIIY